MDIYKSKWFAKFARKEDINDARLCEAVTLAESGRVEGDYGGGLFKQRIARPNQGKSSGFRTFILYRAGDRTVFVFAFAKKDRDYDLDDREQQFYKDLATIVLAYSKAEMAALVEAGKYEEVKCDGEKIPQ